MDQKMSDEIERAGLGAIGAALGVRPTMPKSAPAPVPQQVTTLQDLHDALVNLRVDMNQHAGQLSRMTEQAYGAAAYPMADDPQFPMATVTEKLMLVVRECRRLLDLANENTNRLDIVLRLDDGPAANRTR